MAIQIAQARTNPSVGTTVKLADALGVSITTLLDYDYDYDYDHGPRVRVVPSGEAVRRWSTDGGSHTRSLVGTGQRGPLEMWNWPLMPGEHSASAPYPAGTVELIHVSAGELTLEMDGARHPVPAGARVTFEADVAHAYRDEGDAPAETLMTVAVPPVGRGRLLATTPGGARRPGTRGGALGCGFAGSRPSVGRAGGAGAARTRSAAIYRCHRGC